MLTFLRLMKRVAGEISEKLPNVQVVGEVRATLFCAGVEGGSFTALKGH